MRLLVIVEATPADQFFCSRLSRKSGWFADVLAGRAVGVHDRLSHVSGTHDALNANDGFRVSAALPIKMGMMVGAAGIEPATSPV